MIDTLSAFLLQVVLISLSGVMAPGPITAATLAAGTRSRHAGGLIAIGHGMVEFPLMLLVLAGAGTLVALPLVRVAIGLIGGAFLMVMGAGMFRTLGNAQALSAGQAAGDSVWTGVVLTGGNPYFLLWWVTIGLELTTRAFQLGALAFGLFALVHWLCDLVWLEGVSFASFKGSTVMGNRIQKPVLAVCSVALIGLGVSFIVDALRGFD
jgi:threonine/homoserine/homoserine lactone efflux protein